MSNLQCIAEHTVDLSLIKKESKVLDLGCRSFSWAKAMLEYVDEITCFDPDSDVQTDDERLTVINLAVSDISDAKVKLIKFGNGTGNYIKRNDSDLPEGSSEQIAYTISLPNIIIRLQEVIVDLIKMDIEGEEIPVLLSLKEPPAKQLSVEFHMHTGTTKETIHQVFDHLESLGYVRAHCDYSRKHGLPENYWDVLFILKDVEGIDMICEKYGYPKKVIGI